MDKEAVKIIEKIQKLNSELLGILKRTDKYKKPSSSSKPRLPWPDLKSIHNFINTPVPANWYELSRQERIDYFRELSRGQTEAGFIYAKEKILRYKICPHEVAAELYGLKERDMFNPGLIRAVNMMIGTCPGWVKSANSLNIPGYGKPRCFVRDPKFDTSHLLVPESMDEQLDDILR